MTIFDDIRKDQEAGTPGPWFHAPARRVDVRAGDPVSGMKIAMTTGLANPAMGGRHYEFAANASRIARAPDLEAIALAGEALARACDYTDQYRTLPAEITDAVAAFYAAAGGIK